MRAREAHEPPPGEILVAAVHRVGEQAFHGVSAHGVEERLRGWPGEVARLTRFECRDDVVLLRGGELDERLAVGGAAVGIERREPAPIEVLLIGIGAGERKVDVVEDIGLARPGLPRRAGHEPLGEGRDSGRIVGVEEGAMAVRMRVRRVSCGCGGGPCLILVLGERVGRLQAGADRAYGRADQERAARLIMLAHAECLPGHNVWLRAGGRVRQACAALIKRASSRRVCTADELN